MLDWCCEWQVLDAFEEQKAITRLDDFVGGGVGRSGGGWGTGGTGSGCGDGGWWVGWWDLCGDLVGW